MNRNLIAALFGGLIVFASGSFCAQAAPVLARTALRADAGLIQAVGHRTHHRGYYHRYRDYHRDHRLRHDRDWHRRHYYFYGYEQWRRWNPDYSRAYFYRRYHH